MSAVSGDQYAVQGPLRCRADSHRTTGVGRQSPSARAAATLRRSSAAIVASATHTTLRMSRKHAPSSAKVGAHGRPAPEPAPHAVPAASPSTDAMPQACPRLRLWSRRCTVAAGARCLLLSQLHLQGMVLHWCRCSCAITWLAWMWKASKDTLVQRCCRKQVQPYQHACRLAAVRAGAVPSPSCTCYCTSPAWTALWCCIQHTVLSLHRPTHCALTAQISTVHSNGHCTWAVQLMCRMPCPLCAPAGTLTTMMSCTLVCTRRWCMLRTCRACRARSGQAS
jgi:hypothetical protein